MENTLGLDHAVDAGEMIADIPSTLVWGGQTITGTRGEWARSVDAAEEGILDAVDAEWLGKVSDFSGSTLPAMQTQVTVDSIKCHIVNRMENRDGDVVHFQLRRKAKT